MAVGGRGTLVGAALGAVVVNFAKTYFTGAFPEYWLFGLGALFVLVTLFLPKGILGLVRSRGARRKRRSRRKRPLRSRGAGAGGRAMSETENPMLTSFACSISTASPSRSTATRRCAAFR